MAILLMDLVLGHTIIFAIDLAYSKNNPTWVSTLLNPQVDKKGETEELELPSSTVF